jgi:hypothetical protein
MDVFNSSESIVIPNQIQNKLSGGGASSFNFMTLILIIFLACGCCLLMVAYKFDIQAMVADGIGSCACILLVCFLIYIIIDYIIPCDKRGSSNNQNLYQTGEAIPVEMGGEFPMERDFLVEAENPMVNRSMGDRFVGSNQKLYDYANRFSNAASRAKQSFFYPS